MRLYTIIAILIAGVGGMYIGSISPNIPTALIGGMTWGALVGILHGRWNV